MRLCINKKCSLCSPLFGNFSIAKCCSVVNRFLLFFITFYCLELIVCEFHILSEQIRLFSGGNGQKISDTTTWGIIVSDLFFLLFLGLKVFQGGGIRAISPLMPPVVPDSHTPLSQIPGDRWRSCVPGRLRSRLRRRRRA